jgi:hypothetical protein
MYVYIFHPHIYAVQVQPDPSPPPSAAAGRGRPLGGCQLVELAAAHVPAMSARVSSSSRVRAGTPPRVRARDRSMDRRPCVRDVGRRNPTSYLICCDATLTSNDRQREDGRKLERPVY